MRVSLQSVLPKGILAGFRHKEKTEKFHKADERRDLAPILRHQKKCLG